MWWASPANRKEGIVLRRSDFSHWPGVGRREEKRWIEEGYILLSVEAEGVGRAGCLEDFPGRAVCLQWLQAAVLDWMLGRRLAGVRGSEAMDIW